MAKQTKNKKGKKIFVSEFLTVGDIRPEEYTDNVKDMTEVLNHFDFQGHIFVMEAEVGYDNKNIIYCFADTAEEAKKKMEHFITWEMISKAEAK